MKSIQDLKAISQDMRSILDIRKTHTPKDNHKDHKHIMICAGTGCISSKSEQIFEKLKEELKTHKLENKVQVVKTGCFGLCALGPIIIVYPEGTFYSMINIEDIPEIVESHLVNGKVVEKLIYSETLTDQGIKPLDETNFYKKQHRISLRNCGVINPEDINEYIALGGYQALSEVLTNKTPDDVINIVKDSGLRGRGGGGFSTGLKWSFAKASIDDQKYVCCNADEGDPGAFMDRSILEGDPHVVIEAMAIAGYAIGATQGYIYIRAEYPIAVKRLEIAINQAKEYGLLGKNIFGSNFEFNIDIKLGAGAFVCGEETALMTSIEGKRGEPRPKPPFPAIKGLWGKPTILNNVETFANIPQIIINGPEWFSSIGTEKSKGTKVFALGGNIKNTGLVEIPMGTTLREIVEEIGGGIPRGKKFKAAQTGGPSGGFIPIEYLDSPIDFDNLLSIGTMMGSGALIIMDEDTCMVDIAKFFLDFTVDESCGKCTPCRVGTKRLYEILDRITSGKGKMEDLDKLEKLCSYIINNSLCGLGNTAPQPVLSTLRYFKDEYIDHIENQKCTAGICKNLLKFAILGDKCVGCTLCARKCPVAAISGDVKSLHIIDTDKCIKCGLCLESCKFNAITKN